MKTKLIASTPNMLSVIYTGARTCYNEGSPIDMFENKQSLATMLKLINACINSRHLSVLEHGVFTFAIEGVSRALLAQLTRHRICSFSVQSQRYCKMNNAEFVIPYGLQKEENDKIGAVINHITKTYKELLDAGVKPEDARCILPNACTTNIVMTVNLRELMHIANERLCTKAQKEIRCLVNSMCLEAIKQESWLKDYLKPKCETIGYCPEHKGCGRKGSYEEINRNN